MQATTLSTETECIKEESSPFHLLNDDVNQSKSVHRTEYLDELDLPPVITMGKINRVTSSSTDTISDIDNNDPDWEEEFKEPARKITRPARRVGGRRRRKKRSKGVVRERHIIQHNYHDHAFEPVDFDEFVLDHDTSCAIKKKGGVSIPFPLKLHDLLEKAEEEGLNHIVSWQPHGRAFVVHEPKKFVSQLMHRFFRQTKLTSFQRQLNLYGFCRLTKGPDGGGYYHELFLRGRPYLTKRMIRTKIKGTGYKAASNPECEPDFYSMVPVGMPCSVSPPLSKAGRARDDGTQHPIVTPDTSYGISSVSYGENHLMNAAPRLQELATIGDERVSSKHAHKPFLNPKVVRMGNQSFQYMSPLYPIIGSSDGQNEVSYTSPGDGQGDISISPTIFEDSLSVGTLPIDNDEGRAPYFDPLSVFLSEVGKDFEDDINFGPICDALDKKNVAQV